MHPKRKKAVKFVGIKNEGSKNMITKVVKKCMKRAEYLFLH